MKRSLFLQPMIPPKRFDIFSPLAEGCSEGLDAFRSVLSKKVSEKAAPVSGTNLSTVGLKPADSRQ